MSSIADQLWEDAGAPLIREMYGVSVVYSCAAGEITGITAIADVADYQLVSDDGFPMAVRSRDYTLDVADMQIDSVPVTPSPGHRITEIINGVAQTFEVVPIGNRPAQQLSPNGTRWLVHTKRVAT